LAVSDNYSPNVQIKHKPDGKSNEIILLPIDEIVEVRGWKAIGSKLNYTKLVDIEFIESEVPNPELEIIQVVKRTVDIEIESTSEIKIDEESDTEYSEKAEVSPSIEVEDIPLTIKGEVLESDTDDIPFEIKNYTTDSIPKEANKGEQLGLF
jgi:topoisomerase-4 subunit A